MLKELIVEWLFILNLFLKDFELLERTMIKLMLEIDICVCILYWFFDFNIFILYIVLLFFNIVMNELFNC